VADGFSRLLTIPPTGDVIAALVEIHMSADQYKIIGECHNTIVGHHGFDRTMDKLVAKGMSWPYMREHVKKFIRECNCCQKMMVLRTPIHTHPFVLHSSEPFEVLYMDNFHLEMEDEYGNKYILVIIDGFTRWVELLPLQDLTGKAVAAKLYEYFGRYTQPSRIVSDNGSAFVNEMNDELFRLSGVEHLRTIPHSSEQNGIVERENKEILRHMRNIIFDREILGEWNKALPIVQRILNSEVHSATGVSPVQLLFGKAIIPDRYMFDPRAAPAPHTLSAWASASLELQRKVTLKARMSLQALADERIARAIPNRTHFPVGSYVLIEYPNQDLRKGAPIKLMPRWKGPLLVVEVKGDEYTLRELNTNKHERVHVTRIVKEFLFDAATQDPSDVARRDANAFIVERIVTHKGPRKYKANNQFLVRWKGYGPEDDSWLWWRDLRNNVLLHDYLRENRMNYFIPKEFL
jgi:transposase InsO family protein